MVIGLIKRRRLYLDLIFMVFPRDQFKETMKRTCVLDSFILDAKIYEGFQ